MFLTDSLGLPRKTPEILVFDNTWCYKVASSFKNFIEPIYRSEKGFNTNELLVSAIKDVNLYNLDLIVLQVGIVDCSPRVLTRKELKVVQNMGFLGNKIHKYIKNNYDNLSVKRDIAYVNPNEFENNLKKFIELANNVPIYPILIAKPCNEYIKKSPLISERIIQYNNIIKKIFNDNVIDPFKNVSIDNLDSMFMEDGYHLNEYGHEFVANEVKRELSIKKFSQLI